MFSEVVEKGRELGRGDALVIGELVNEKKIKVIKPDPGVVKNLMKTTGMVFHRGEAETLALAKKLRAVAVINESIGRTAGEVTGIETRGSAFIIGLLLARKKIDKKTAGTITNQMVEEGWRLSTEDYAKIMKSLEKPY